MSLPGPRLLIPLGLAAALLASGCASRLRMSPDFGVAVREDMAAQIANPDARYRGDPPPGSDGSRAALAETRYKADKVTRPSVSSTAGVYGSSGSGSGSDAGAGDAGNAPAPPPQ